MSTETLAKVAHDALRRGDLQRASLVYEQLLASDPSSLLALNRLAEINLKRGHFARSIELLERSLRLAEGQPFAWAQMGTALRGSGKRETALECYNRAIALKADLAGAFFDRAVLLTELNRPDEALRDYDRAINLAPQVPWAYCGRGAIHAERKNFTYAIRDYNKSIELKPAFALAYYRRATVHRACNRLDDAVRDFDQAIELQPDFADAYWERGRVRFHRQQLREAFSDLDYAITLKPVPVGYHYRAMIRHVLKQYDAALADYDRAIELNPKFADAYWSKAETLLVQGNYAEGWKLYEHRLRTRGARNMLKWLDDYPLWTGDHALNGKCLLIRPEAGFGDTIMFARYVFAVVKAGARAILCTPQPLVPLFATLAEAEPSVSIVAEGEPLPQVDFQCPIRSLPERFKTTLATIPALCPYLKVPAARQTLWRNRIKHGTLRVGLVWSSAGNRRLEASPFTRRSMAFTQITPLLQLPLDFHSLQKDVSAEDKSALDSFSNIERHEHNLNDFADTAALINELDLIISVDTAVANLAGALGKPVWVMLPYSCDFRWMDHGERTPWYPTAKLFRQTTEIGNWEAIVANVKEELQRYCDEFIKSAR